MFHIGQKVVCVDDNPDYLGKPPQVVLNKVYQIRGISKYYGLFLEETKCNYGYGFLPTRFRPLIEKKTDTGMATLKKIARDVSNKQIVPIKEDVE